MAASLSPWQEYGDALKVVKVEADGNTASIEKYKVGGPSREEGPHLHPRRHTRQQLAGL